MASVWKANKSLMNVGCTKAEGCALTVNRRKRGKVIYWSHKDSWMNDAGSKLNLFSSGRREQRDGTIAFAGDCAVRPAAGCGVDNASQRMLWDWSVFSRPAGAICVSVAEPAWERKTMPQRRLLLLLLMLWHITTTRSYVPRCTGSRRTKRAIFKVVVYAR